MRVLAKPVLKAFWEKHPDAETAIRAWYSEAEQSTWRTPQHIKNRYLTASFVGDNRVVFNIKGNNYRLVVHVRYDTGFVYVRFVGTHAEYNGIEARTV